MNSRQYYCDFGKSVGKLINLSVYNVVDVMYTTATLHIHNVSRVDKLLLC